MVIRITGARRTSKAGRRKVNEAMPFPLIVLAEDGHKAVIMFAEDGHKAVIIVHRLAVPVYSSIEVIKILLYRSLTRWE